MRFDIDIHVNLHLQLSDAVWQQLGRLITQQGDRIMGALDPIREQLRTQAGKLGEIATAQSTAATATAEILLDLREVLQKLANGVPGSTEVAETLAEATALTDQLTVAADKAKADAETLQEVAALYTADPPPPPPA